LRCIVTTARRGNGCPDAGVYLARLLSVVGYTLIFKFRQSADIALTKRQLSVSIWCRCPNWKWVNRMRVQLDAICVADRNIRL
jgi:hypothetical protein